MHVGHGDVNAMLCERFGHHEANPLPAGDQCDLVEDVHKLFNATTSLRRPPTLSGMVSPDLRRRFDGFR
jgi:hypothetical protein